MVMVNRLVGSKNTAPRVRSLGCFHEHSASDRNHLVLQITDVIDADDLAACIADWFIASDVRLAQDVGLSEIAFALRNSCDGFTLRVKNGAYRCVGRGRSRPVIVQAESVVP